MELTVTPQVAADATILGLAGWLDTTTAPILQQELLPRLQGGQSIVLDFSGVEYISSAGMRVLLAGEQTSHQTGTRQVLRNVTPEVLGILKMAGFDGILVIE